MFASTVHAFATLDDETKARLPGRHGFHSLIAQDEMKSRHVPLTDEQKAPNPDRCHPHVWPHPRSGRDCLYVNEGTTFGIEGPLRRPPPQDRLRGKIDPLSAG
jgi:taurine dioxygenase